MYTKNLIFIPLITLALLLSNACNSKHSAPEYEPLYNDNWARVDSFIRDNWINYSGDCSSLPDSFAYAFWCGCQFYWDTYFTQLGLLVHDELRLSYGGMRNLFKLIDSLGFVPNANVDWGDNRSQPPYLSMMVRSYFEVTNDTTFLRHAYPYLLKEYCFWTDPSDTIEDNATTIKGLQRYHNHASRTELLSLFNHELAKRFKMDTLVPDSVKLKVADGYASEAETGMDFTPRFEGRCADFAALDLNCNLYMYEQNFAFFEEKLGVSQSKYSWVHLANARKNLINKYFWNEERGLYLDYDFINQRSAKVASALTFSPLYAGLASDEQARRVVENLPLLESTFGIVATEPIETTVVYQWDHTAIWPPFQSLTVMALDRYGYTTEARRIAAKYLDVVAKNYISPVPEKFIGTEDTFIRKSGNIYEKYLKDGTINDREYKANTMFGWSAGTYAFLYKYYQNTVNN